MSYRSHGATGKRDEAEAVIAEYLQVRGAYVHRLSGKALPDLLVGWCGRWLLLECKTGNAKLEPDQEAFQKEANRRGLPGFTVRNLEDARDILDRVSRLTKLEGQA